MCVTALPLPFVPPFFFLNSSTVSVGDLLRDAEAIVSNFSFVFLFHFAANGSCVLHYEYLPISSVEAFLKNTWWLPPFLPLFSRFVVGRKKKNIYFILFDFTAVDFPERKRGYRIDRQQIASITRYNAIDFFFFREVGGGWISRASMRTAANVLTDPLISLGSLCVLHARIYYRKKGVSRWVYACVRVYLFERPKNVVRFDQLKNNNNYKDTNTHEGRKKKGGGKHLFILLFLFR